MSIVGCSIFCRYWEGKEISWLCTTGKWWGIHLWERFLGEDFSIVLQYMKIPFCSINTGEGFCSKCRLICIPWYLTFYTNSGKDIWNCEQVASLLKLTLVMLPFKRSNHKWAKIKCSKFVCWRNSTRNNISKIMQGEIREMIETVKLSAQI